MNDKIKNYYFDKILIDLKGENVKQVFHILSDHASRLTGGSADNVYTDLIQQNHDEGCGVGDGVAIPHITLPRLARPFVIFAKTQKVIEFKSYDDEPCDLICLIISPERKTGQHLQSLARITRSFNDQDFCDALRQANDNDDIRFAMREFTIPKMAA